MIVQFRPVFFLNSLANMLMVARQHPHMPVPSTMMVLRLTTVLMLCGRVTSDTALIMTTGPIPMTRSICVFSSMRRFSTSVTKPWCP